MANEDFNTDDNGSESTRKRISRREYRNEAGEKVTRPEDAVSCAYMLRNSNGGEIEFAFEPVTDHAATRMVAMFGFFTKVGNVANSVLNDKNDPGSPEDAKKEIEEFLSLLENGEWAERTATQGARIDRALLAQAYVAYAATQGQHKNVNEVQAKLEEDPALVRKANAIPQVKIEYLKLKGADAVGGAMVQGL